MMGDCEIKEIGRRAEIAFEKFIEVWESSSLLSKLMLITGEGAVIDLNDFVEFKVIVAGRHYCIYNDRKLIFGFKPVNTNKLVKVGEI